VWEGGERKLTPYPIPTPLAGIRTGVTASSATEGYMLGAVAVAS